jgi:hypothetical protein
VFKFPINPTKLGFKALGIECQLHQQYIFEHFEVHLPATASDFVNGDCIGWYNRDPNEPEPAGEDALQIAWYKGGQQCTFRKGHTWTMPRFPNLPALYCQDNGSDERFVDQAVFTCDVVNPPSVYTGTTPGQVDLNIELWCSYSVRFMVKNIDQNPTDRPQYAVTSTDDAKVCTPEDPLGFDGPLSIAPALKPANADGWIPGLFYAKVPLPDALERIERNKNGPNTVPIDGSAYGILAGYGMDTACGFNSTSLTIGTLTQGYPLDLTSYGVNIDVLLASGNGYTASTSAANIDSLLEIPVPGLISDMDFPSGLRVYNGSTGLFDAQPPGVYQIIWAHIVAYGQATELYNNPTNENIWISMLCGSSGPPLAAWAGDATVEGQCLAAYRNLSPKQRHGLSLKQFIARYKALRKPQAEPKDKALMEALITQVSAEQTTAPPPLEEVKVREVKGNTDQGAAIPESKAVPPLVATHLANRRAALLREAAASGWTLVPNGAPRPVGGQPAESSFSLSSGPTPPKK